MVFEKDVKDTVDGKANKPRGVGTGKYAEKAYDHNKAEAIEVYRSCFQRK